MQSALGQKCARKVTVMPSISYIHELKGKMHRTFDRLSEKAKRVVQKPALGCESVNFKRKRDDEKADTLNCDIHAMLDFIKLCEKDHLPSNATTFYSNQHGDRFE